MRLNRRGRILLTILVVFLFLLVLITYLPSNGVAETKITGTDLVSSSWIDEIVATCDVNNFYLYPKRKVSTQIRTEIPQIRAVKFSKNWLTRVVTLRIVERKAFANIMAYPEHYIVDNEGYILNLDKDMELITIEKLMDIPIISGLKNESMIGIRKLPENYSSIIRTTLRHLVEIFDDGGVTFNLSNLNDIRVLTKDLIEIKIGNTQEIKEKLRVLNLLLPDIKNIENLEYIDIRYPVFPVVKYIR